MIKRLTIALSALGILAGVCIGHSQQRNTDAAVQRNLSIFNDIVKEVSNNYVDSLRADEAFHAAIGAFLNTIDPYTEYYDSDEQESIIKMTTGEYGGIGSYLLERDGKSYIAGPMEDSPSARAGIRAGDHIVRVDTIDVSNKPTAEVTKLLRGTPGTTVEVVLHRPYVTDSVINVTLEREKLQQPSVTYYGVINDTTGYILLSQFIDKSPEEVRTALESFKANPNVRNLILDLRGNGGGVLESAVDIVGFFVPKGTEVVRTRGRDANNEKIYKTTSKPIMPDIPMAVLIDGATASASEITAGALQDLDRAVLVGSRSFGKGLVQGTRQVPYDGLLKMTIAKYYIPSGRLIQALDYSRRNPDGSAMRMPDSLTNVYKTLHGREVRDGGGLQPDVTVEWPEPNRLVYNIVRGNWTFDFANKYAAEHPEIGDPYKFEITDTIYSDFKKSIDPTRLEYDKVCEQMVTRLRETAKSEGYINEETTEALDNIARLLTHNLDKDLDTHREQISEYLGSEMLSRYYYDRGRTIYSLHNDRGVEEARSILNDAARYKELLSPATPAKSNKK